MARKDLNRCEFIGVLGRDPDMRYTSSGTAVTNFSIACNRIWKSTDGEQNEETEWINFVAWGKLGEICTQYLTKGSRVWCEGRMQTRSWEDKETGVTRYKTEIVLNDMIMLDGKKSNGGNSDYEEETTPAAQPQRQQTLAKPATRPAAKTLPTQHRKPTPIDDDLDDLPF